MIQIPARFEFLCRLSLSFLWLFTAGASFWWGRHIGYEVLAQQHIQGEFADWCINAGCILDALIGVWLLTAYKLKWCYRLQIILIVSYRFLVSSVRATYQKRPNTCALISAA